MKKLLLFTFFVACNKNDALVSSLEDLDTSNICSADTIVRIDTAFLPGDTILRIDTVWQTLASGLEMELLSLHPELLPQLLEAREDLYTGQKEFPLPGDKAIFFRSYRKISCLEIEKNLEGHIGAVNNLSEVWQLRRFCNEVLSVAISDLTSIEISEDVLFSSVGEIPEKELVGAASNILQRHMLVISSNNPFVGFEGVYEEENIKLFFEDGILLSYENDIKEVMFCKLTSFEVCWQAISWFDGLNAEETEMLPGFYLKPMGK